MSLETLFAEAKFQHTIIILSIKKTFKLVSFEQ